MKKRIRLRVKTFIYFGFGALVLIGLFYFFSIYISARTFDDYKMKSRQDMDLAYVEYIKEMYEQGVSPDSMKDYIFAYARQDQAFFRLLDSSGQLIWELLRSQGSPQGHMGQGRYQYVESDVVFTSYGIETDGKMDLVLQIGRTEQIVFSEADITFKNNLNRGLVLIAILGIVITAIISFVLSKQISDPILKIRDSAARIKEGKYSEKADINTGTLELAELAETINDLGSNLESQENLRIRLTSDVSHELRTPLNILQNEIEALMDGIWEPTKKRFEQCHEEITRLTGLVNDLEHLTDISNYSLEIKLEDVPMNELIEDIIDRLKSKFDKKHLLVTFEKNSDKIPIKADRNKISQVLLNLLSNAYKFTPEGGRITVKTSIENHFFVIRVKDNGIGIDAKDLPHVFERFYRADYSRSRDTGGAGLGLSITKGIIEAHHGNISVGSLIGVGTEFVVKLPVDSKGIKDIMI
ncbi:MAG: HAMP domain-containing histidine kinase [Tissierellales bacterium]|nr:HAMP domain-containing histidine kinase [Tissierellales bacterium]MBN2827427.1 HAMP domain-containing histidine kinase [Tissierellales bacterium]